MLETIKQIKRDYYFIFLLLLAISIPLSKFAVTVSQIILLFIWLFDGVSKIIVVPSVNKVGLLTRFIGSIKQIGSHVWRNISIKIKLFSQNKVALVLASLYLLHVLGLFYTSDFIYAAKDLRIKLPLLLLPLIMSSMPPINKPKIILLLSAFVAAVFVGSLFSMNEYLKKDFIDIRHISFFMNSIRFSLIIVFSIFILLYFLASFRQINIWLKAAMLAVVLWFISFIMLLESAIGVLSLIVLTSGLLFVQVFRSRSMYLKVIMALLLITIPVLLFWYIRTTVIELSTAPPINLSKLPTHTALGNPYIHDTINFGIEDGKYVGLFISEDELAQAWDNRSQSPFYGANQIDKKTQYIVIRYLTSRNLPKDASGVERLSQADINHIENGIANINYIENPSVRTRISKFLIGYQRFKMSKDPSGESILQRAEYLKASLLIIKEHFWFGVGTGDLPNAFNETYDRMNSPLKDNFRWRSHNQYFSIFVAFGFFGFLWFLFTLVYPVMKTKKHHHFLYVIFLSIMLLSMITEDTIESQEGLTIFAFFNAIFLIAYRETNEIQQ